MFKNLTVVVLAVLLSTTANAQAKKRAKKKAPAPTTTEAPATTEATPAPEAPAAAEPAAYESAPAAVSSAGAGQISQFNWQPSAGQSAVQIGLNYGMASIETDPGGSKTDVTAMTIPLSYHYGFTSTNSVGVSTDFGNETYKSTGSELKYTGLGDIVIHSRNYSPMGGGKLLYGISLGFSPGKAKIASSSPAQDGNRNSGGLSLPIYVGYEADMGGSYAGVRLDYAVLMDRQVDVAGDPKLKGGSPLELLGYYESGAQSHWNAYIGYGMTGEVTVDPGGSVYEKASSYVPLGASWGTYLSPGMLLAVHYDGQYRMAQDTTTANVKNKAHLRNQLGVRARWEF